MPNVPYSGLNEVSPSTEVGNDYVHSNASSDAFGADVGQAVQNAGNVGQDIAKHYAQMAVEAKANDVIAKQYAPEVAKLSGSYLQTQGIDAISGYNNYTQALANVQNKYIDQANSPAEKQILGAYISRHVAQEVDTAQRHQDQQIHQSIENSNKAFIGTLSDNAITNFNNPQVVEQSKAQIDAQIQKHGIDTGQSQDVISQQQQEVWGGVARGIITRSMLNGDLTTAQKTYQKYQDTLPGSDQIEVEKLMHAHNMSQFGEKAATNILSGLTVPNPPIGSPADVKAVVVDAAQAKGVDPSHALAVTSIESSMGANVGKRGDIGQTGKRGDLPTQADAMMDKLKKSHDAAYNTFGRDPEGWEDYCCYQQGEGGGPALLKAAQNNPAAKAVDVLTPLYKNPADAKSAIVDNGGNTTMTSGQFLDLIKSKYSQALKREAVTLPASTTAPVQNPEDSGKVIQASLTTDEPKQLGAAIVLPHTQGGVAVQKGASAIQNLNELNKVWPDVLQRAMEIPNVDQRNAVIEALENKKKLYTSAAQAETSTMMNQVHQLVSDPNFTSMDQVPKELQTALMSDHAQTLSYIQQRADANLNRSAGGTNHDAKEYGEGVDDATQGIWNGEITDSTQLQKLVATHKLTLAGYDRMQKLMSEKGTPEGNAESKLQEQTFKTVKDWFLGKSEMYGIHDPEGQEGYNKAMALMFKQIDQAKKDGVSTSDMYDPASDKWIGNIARPLVKTMEQRMKSLNTAVGSGGAVKSSDITIPPSVPPANKRPSGYTWTGRNGITIQWNGSSWDELPPVPAAQ